VFLDESGIDHSFYRKYARNLVGSRAYGEISGKRVSRTTLIAAYVKGGFMAPFRFKGYTDTSVFNQWIETCLVPELRPGQVVIMDNAAFHKSKRTLELIEAAGCRVLFLPPYSPDLNKIEPMWANIKQRLRSYYDHSLSFFENLDRHLIEMCKF
jgi:transposase